MNRRSFLSFLSVAPVALPIAAATDEIGVACAGDALSVWPKVWAAEAEYERVLKAAKAGEQWALYHLPHRADVVRKTVLDLNRMRLLDLHRQRLVTEQTSGSDNVALIQNTELQFPTAATDQTRSAQSHLAEIPISERGLRCPWGTNQGRAVG